MKGMNRALIAMMMTATPVVFAQDRPNAGQAGGAQNGPVTLTGCVTRADMSYASGRQAVDGRAVTSGGNSDRFVLADAKPAAQREGAGGSGALTSNTDPVAFSGARYELVGDSADLRTHLGHQIEVTGTMNMPASRDDSSNRPTATGTSGTASESGRAGASGTAGASASGATAGSGGSGPAALGATEPRLPQLKIDSVKMIAAACETK